jgi:flagellar hook-associated protein 2
VADDVIALKQAIKGFVDAYNGVVDTVGRLTSYNRDNRSAGPLLGDGPTRNVLSGLRTTLAGRSGEPGGDFATLVDIGISSNVNGRLGIDVARLDRAIDGDVDGVRQLFAAEGSGLADRLAPVLAGALDTGGIASREDRIKDQLRTITASRQQLDLRMDQVRRRLERQFNSLDQLVQQLNSSGNFLLKALNSGQ